MSASTSVQSYSSHHTAKLFAAIDRRDHAKVKKLLRKKANPNAWDPKKEESALHRAARLGYNVIARTLLNYGANPDRLTGPKANEHTALTLAAVHDRPLIVRRLLIHGVDADQEDKKVGVTALAWAVRKKSPKAMRALLARGSSCRKRGRNDTNALMDAKTWRSTCTGPIWAYAEEHEPRAILDTKLIFSRIYLAHACHIGGHSLLDKDSPDDRLIKLTGSYDDNWRRKLHKSSHQLESMQSPYFPSELLKHIRDLLIVGRTYRKQVERHNNGLPVLIRTGYNGHTAFFVAWGPYFVVVNRGAGRKVCLEAFTHNHHKLGVDLLKRISTTKSRTSGSVGYKKFLYEEVKAELELKGTELSAVIQDCGDCISKQTVGNCTYANLEGAVFTIFVIWNILKGLPADKVMKISLRQYYNWASFNRAYAMNFAMDQAPSPDYYDHRIMREAVASIYEWEDALDPAILDYVNSVTQAYSPDRSKRQRTD